MSKFLAFNLRKRLLSHSPQCLLTSSCSFHFNLIGLVVISCFFLLFIFVASMSSGLSLQFLVLLLLDIKNSLTVSLVGRWAVWSERASERYRLYGDIVNERILLLQFIAVLCCTQCDDDFSSSSRLTVCFVHISEWERDMRMVINRDLCLVVQWDQHQALNFCIATIQREILHFSLLRWDVYEWKIDEVRFLFA